MNFDYTPKVRELEARLTAFMDAHVYPNERRYRDEVAANRARGNPWVPTTLVEELKTIARRSLRLADGPDEVHRNAIAKMELREAHAPNC